MMQETGKDAAFQTGVAEPDGAAAKESGEPASLPARKLNRLAEAERKKARAAEKLRENLLRRKQQVRARRSGDAETGIGLPAGRPGDDDGEA